jgi:hypothetical protein
VSPLLVPSSWLVVSPLLVPSPSFVVSLLRVPSSWLVVWQSLIPSPSFVVSLLLVPSPSLVVSSWLVVSSSLVPSLLLVPSLHWFMITLPYLKSLQNLNEFCRYNGWYCADSCVGSDKSWINRQLGNYMKRCFCICACHQILFGRRSQREWPERASWHVWWNLKGRDRFGDVGVHTKIILKWMFIK